MSWIRKIPSLSASPTIEPRSLLCDASFDVTLLLEVLLLFVGHNQFLVQQLIEQLEILETSLDIAVFPESCQVPM